MADGVNYSIKGFDQYEVLLGDELRGERATLGKSLLDVQRDLKIKASYIAAIENCDLEVFSNKGFIAGYVRSYARYLSLDPEIIYERFCREADFTSVNSALTWEETKSDQMLQKNFGAQSTWKPGVIGLSDDRKIVFLDIISRSAPIFLVLVVLVGAVWGGMSVLQQVQRLDVVAVEEVPQVFKEQLNIVSNPSEIILSDNNYSSEELTLPVFEPRDRALSTLKLDAITALENRFDSSIIAYSNLNLGSTPTKKGLTGKPNFELVGSPDPIVRTAPHIPSVKLLAMTPAWVRVKNEFDDIVFEKILKERETYIINKDLFSGQVRAGNAQNVYFVVDSEVFGPLSLTSSVAKKVALNPQSIKSNYAISFEARNAYFAGGENEIAIDTAEMND